MIVSTDRRDRVEEVDRPVGTALAEEWTEAGVCITVPCVRNAGETGEVADCAADVAVLTVGLCRRFSILFSFSRMARLAASKLHKVSVKNATDRRTSR